MERSDKKAADGVATTPEEAAEIDRIMKEIEDLEKNMDSPSEADLQPAERTAAKADEPAIDPVSEVADIIEANGAEEAKVVPIRPVTESLAETDAVPVVDAPLVNHGANPATGNLSLKIGGLTEVALEFSHADTTVYFAYNDEGLKITTDQGAEFRIPYKRAA